MYAGQPIGPRAKGLCARQRNRCWPAPGGDRRLAERLDGLFCGYTNMIMDSCLSSRVRLGNGLGWVGLKRMWQLTLGLDVAPSQMAGVWFQVTYRPKGQGVVRKTAVQVLARTGWRPKVGRAT